MKVHRDTFKLGRFAAAAAVAMAAGAAHARQNVPDENGPVIIGEGRGKYIWWDLQRFSCNLEFYGEFRHDELKTQGQPNTTLDDNRIRFDTNISFESFIGHKNLIDLTGDFKLGYEDHKITSSVGDTDVHEEPFIDFYNVQALILGEGPAPVTIYSLRDETIISREFNTSLRTLNNETGAIISFNSDVAPTRLQYFHRDQTQSDDVQIDDSSTQDTFNLQSGIHLAEHQRLEITYNFDSIDESQSNGFDSNYDRNDGMVTHTLDFGDNSQHNLRSSVRYYDQTGEFGETDLHLDENLLLHHSDTLETRYDFAAVDQTYGDADQRIYRGNAQLRHKLYESLVSTFNVGGTHLDYPDSFTSDDAYVSSYFEYTKKVPYGRLNASLGFAFDHQVNSDRGSDVFILNEQHVFNDMSTTVLNHRNIVPSSIVMTNRAGNYTYIQGLDYTVEEFPDHVEIKANPFGPNPPIDGQNVLVDYLIGPEPGNTIDAFSQSYGMRYTIEEGWLRGLALYTYYLTTNHTLETDSLTPIILDDTSDFRIGSEYRIGELTLLAEWRDHGSTVSPYTETRLESRYDRRLGRDSTLSIAVLRNEIDYTDTDEHFEHFRALGRWNQRLTTDFDFSLYLQYRDEKDTIAGDVNGLEEAVELHWHHGRTSAYVTFRNSQLDGDDASRTSQTITVGFIRSF